VYDLIQLTRMWQSPAISNHLSNESTVIVKVIIIVLLIVIIINCQQLYTVKKYFQDLLSQHIFFCQINFIIIYLVEIT